LTNFSCLLERIYNNNNNNKWFILERGEKGDELGKRRWLG
jgi:hypothetical protein